ncbi:Putative 2-hydroxyacid dehydrogenase [Pseudoalteromonas holothuriae]|uniref:2-hydroxyacid dehydrogenase n=1 Tax=Pseudoalteromonas holothuriae TaxID=2963714 RepID=A0ABN8UJ46_9GAMM|nr:D-2-hydroxyacid dehydrogenase [Pseudoalteromonas sp. CIP111951]CAH9055871.1 Putative 2-hydroxyacid dehydrogenase [Pseudoalteromonas sp. CIP111951]
MNIVILDAKTLANTSLSPLQKLGQVTVYSNTPPTQVISRCQHADIIITNKVILNASTIACLPNLKLICVAATGTNNIDLNAAKANNISVQNVAGYSTPSVVQLTFTLLGNLMGNVHRYNNDCKQGLWQKSDMFCRLDHPITEINAKQFVIIGYGALGKAVANVAHAFGAHVVIAERRHSKKTRAGRTDFDQALRQADIISVHCPLTEHTKNLFDESVLSLLKPSAVLINTARGGIVNEQALVDALNNKQLAGAGIDVLSQEPADANNPLLHYCGENLLVTPHIAWASKESITRLVQQIADNIQKFIKSSTTSKVV